MMNTMFKQQIDQNMKVYVDDMIVKSLTPNDHVQDLKECFQSLRQYNMRLNPIKCTFRLASGKFLGFLITEIGVYTNFEKI